MTTINPRAVIGDNAPSLNETYDDLVQRVMDATEPLPFDEIKTESQAIEISRIAKAAQKAAAEAKAAKAAEKRPLLDASKIIDAFFGALETHIADFVEQCRTLVDDYQKRKEAVERARLAELARQEKERAEAELAAARTADQFSDAVTRLDETQAAADRVTQARGADLARVTSGGLSVAHRRETWAWEIVDETAVPRAYLSPNKARIDAAVCHTSGLRKVPGLRIFQKQTTVFR